MEEIWKILYDISYKYALEHQDFTSPDIYENVLDIRVHKIVCKEVLFYQLLIEQNLKVINNLSTLTNVSIECKTFSEIRPDYTRPHGPNYIHQKIYITVPERYEEPMVEEAIQKALNVTLSNEVDTKVLSKFKKHDELYEFLRVPTTDTINSLFLYKLCVENDFYINNKLYQLSIGVDVDQLANYSLLSKIPSIASDRWDASVCTEHYINKHKLGITPAFIDNNNIIVNEEILKGTLYNKQDPFNLNKYNLKLKRIEEMKNTLEVYRHTSLDRMVDRYALHFKEIRDEGYMFFRKGKRLIPISLNNQTITDIKEILDEMNVFYLENIKIFLENHDNPETLKFMTNELQKNLLENHEKAINKLEENLKNDNDNPEKTILINKLKQDLNVIVKKILDNIDSSTRVNLNQKKELIKKIEKVFIKEEFTRIVSHIRENQKIVDNTFLILEKNYEVQSPFVHPHFHNFIKFWGAHPKSGIIPKFIMPDSLQFNPDLNHKELGQESIIIKNHEKFL